MSVKSKIITLIVVLVVCIAMIVYGTFTEGKAISDILPRFILVVLSAVIVIIKLLSGIPKKAPKDNNSIKNDIKTAKEWIVTALKSSDYQADFSMESLKEIDRFFDEQSGEGGILQQNLGGIIFGLGVYVGETVIANVGGEWDVDNCHNETEIMVKINDKTTILPVLRVMARYKEGNENSIYAYGQSIKNGSNE